MIMTKVPNHPRIHNWGYNFMIPVESASTRKATLLPLVTYDEGLGAMSAYKSNPVNANFTETVSDHCYPTSRVNSIFAMLTVGMNKIMLETDKVSAIKFATAQIHTAFNETGQALDEVSTLDLNEILELQVETTNRVCFPLYNAIDLADFKSNAGLDMPADQDGLDTDLEIEAIAINTANIHDARHYFTNGDKLKSTFTGLHYHTLTRQHPVKTIFFKQFSNTKYMNPYTANLAMVYVPPMTSEEQYGKPTDTTIETSGLEFSFTARFNEFNFEFDHDHTNA